MNEMYFKYEALRSGVPFKTLLGLDGGSINCDSSAEIKRSVSCSIASAMDVDFLRDELRISLVRNGVESPLGIFTVTTMPKSVDEYGAETYQIEGYDRTYRVQRTRLESRADGYVAAGANYISAVEGFLIRCGITDMIIQPTDLTLSMDREEWEVGESYLAIINTLLNEINYEPIWFDNDGFARSGPIESPVYKAPDFSYHAGKRSIILTAHQTEDDTFGAANVFTVGVSNAETEMYAVSVNDDPTSRLSTVNRGRISAPVQIIDDVSDLDTLQAYADRLKFKSMMSTETASISTEIEPGHALHNVIEVEIPGLQGKFEEVAWSIQLSLGGLMTHKMRRAVYV